MNTKFPRTRRNAESIGLSLSVILAWGIAEFSGVNVPPEVTAALSGLITAIAARMKDEL